MAALQHCRDMAVLVAWNAPHPSLQDGFGPEPTVPWRGGVVRILNQCVPFNTFSLGFGFQNDRLASQTNEFISFCFQSIPRCAVLQASILTFSGSCRNWVAHVRQQSQRESTIVSFEIPELKAMIVFPCFSWSFLVFFPLQFDFLGHDFFIFFPVSRSSSFLALGCYIVGSHPRPSNQTISTEFPFRQ